MSNGTFANEDVMEDYLSALLTEEQVSDPVQRQSVARLLETAPEVIEKKVIRVTPEISEKTEVTQDLTIPEVVPEEAKDISPSVETEIAVAHQSVVAATMVRPDTRFQALFFKLAGLTLAVPLTELGGIHKLDKVSPLFGKPAWFNGVMLHRDEKISVVDTANWIMPEKYDEKLAESLNYQYLIMLDDSDWGLACEKLVTTVTLEPDDVKWRDGKGKRPWLAGMVKEKMCALVDVKSLIVMLNQGLDSSG